MNQTPKSKAREAAKATRPAKPAQPRKAKRPASSVVNAPPPYRKVATKGATQPIIISEAEYNRIVKRVDVLMRKGEANVTAAESKEIRDLALKAQAYEQSIYTIPAPQTLEDILELEMFRRKLKQKEAAKILGVGESKFSEILSGKRAPDVAFLKAAHIEFGIDGNMLLEIV